MPGRRRTHYGGNYAVRAKAVTDAAKANPFTTCWRCGRTLAEARALAPGKRVFWTAGHTIDGDPFCPLLAECSPCNFRAGQALASSRRGTSGGTGRV
jgi:hypothetical protein